MLSEFKNCPACKSDNKNHENMTAGNEDDFVSLEEISDYPVFVYLI